MKDNLLKVGFKQIEAEIYLVLLKEKGITAYKISKILKKTKAQIYKALEIMLQKGMVYNNELSKAVEYFPTDIKTYLHWKEKEFLINKQEAEEKASSITEIKNKSGIFTIENIDQMYSRSLEIIKKAKNHLIVMCIQLQKEEIIEELQKAADRGVNVIIQSFLPKPSLRNVDIIAQGNSVEVFNKYQYNWLEIFADGEEFVLSIMDHKNEKLYKSIWSNDPYLSVIFYNANVGEFLFSKTFQELSSDKDKQEITEILKKFRQKYYIGIDMQKIHYLID